MRAPEYAPHGPKQAPRLEAESCRATMNLSAGITPTLLAVNAYPADAVPYSAAEAAIPAEA